MKRIENTNSGKERRKGNRYLITEEEIQSYKDLGYLILNDVLTEEELSFLDPWFDHFMSGKEQERMGRDFCDMSQPYGTPLEDFQLVNAMLPSKYAPELKDNIFTKVAQSIADQLYTDGIAKMDYEQFLGKKPSKSKAEFAMHQDLGYWPKTKNTWTATFSLALTDSELENGCLQVVPGTNKEAELRKHKPISFDTSKENESRGDAHTLVIESKATDEIVYLPVKRGSITIHDERIVHGSGGNLAKTWRKTYVMAFRDAKTIEEERAMGFTHSHNDKLDWKDVIGE